jgi:hypothetical protein
MNSKIIGLVFSLIVIYCAYLPVVSGDDIDLGGEPSYSLLIETSNKQLNHGDSFEIELSIAGLGDVEVSDFVVSIPAELPRDKKIKFTEIVLIPIGNNTYHHIATKTNQSSRFWYLIPNIFYQLPEINQTNHSGMFSGASPLPVGQARFTIDAYDYAPFTIDFIIADDAPSGDHEMPITYNYKSNGKWYQDKEYIKIHINRFYETNTFYIIAAIFTILGLTVLIIEIIKGAFDARKFFKKSDSKAWWHFW